MTRHWPVLLVLVLLVACGSSPTAPTPPDPPTVGLTVVVVGHISKQPLVSMTVDLNTPAGITTPSPLSQSTNHEGKVSWRVQPGHPYSITVNGVRHFHDSVVNADTQWLLSLPL